MKKLNEVEKFRIIATVCITATTAYMIGKSGKDKDIKRAYNQGQADAYKQVMLNIDDVVRQMNRK